MSEAASYDFVVGLSARHSDAAIRLSRSVADREPGFAPADLIARIKNAFGRDAAAAEAEPQPQPRGYAPADPASNPTEGWNPLDANAEPAPFIDPAEVARQAGHDEGYAAGLAAARAEAAATAERDRALLAALAETLCDGARIDRDRLAKHMRQTVEHLVTRLVGEIGISADLLAARVAAATDLIADASESAILRINPADMQLLDGHLPATLYPVADAQIARGSFELETPSTIVEDGPDLWLDQLAAALDKVAVPGT